jgi:deoxyribodipyrimidine photo-lyase
MWFRRDFRLNDNTALHHAAREAADGAVIPVFILDDAILRHPETGAAIVQFMLGCLATLRDNLAAQGVDLLVLHGRPVEQLAALVKQTGSNAVYFNKDYDPRALERDDEVRRVLGGRGVDVRAFKDQVIFEERELLAGSTGEAYTVYTPYAKAWRKRLAETIDVSKGPATWPAPKLKPWQNSLRPIDELRPVPLPSPGELGFTEGPEKMAVEPGEDVARDMLKAWCTKPIRDYPNTRNTPALPNGTSRLSPHLRHGTLSPRQCLRAATYVATRNPAFGAGVEKWVSELIWREFYQQILFNFPHVIDEPFKRKLATIPWENDAALFEAWCAGRTGFPIVDAAMRQLNQTGWMHNRLRMIVAMFLTKDLRIDYRKGERYFMQRLIDCETAQNNGGWQWSASTGTDAQPYFRIFNPASQSEKCDPDGSFIRTFVPELARVPGELIHAPHEMTPLQQETFGCRIGTDYPAPIVDHATARAKTLAMFQSV